MLLCKTIPWGFLLSKILISLTVLALFEENVKKPQNLYTLFSVFIKNTKQFIDP